MGTVGTTLLGCPLPLAAATGMVVVNALGLANMLDYTIGATRATGDCGRRGELAAGITC